MSNESGFVAGTLVHTNKGLVPIQNLKVGDLVLSKSENGEGETAYTKVLKTFKSAEKMPIMGPFLGVFCTANHPFWVDGEGWVAAEYLDRFSGGPVVTLNQGLLLPTYSYENAIDIFKVGGLYLVQTTEPGLVIHVQNLISKNATINNVDFDLVDFRSGVPLIVYADDDNSSLGYYSKPAIKYIRENGLNKMPGVVVLNGELDREAISYYDQLIDYVLSHGGFDTGAYQDYVYNIEVENFHTYFIHEDGYWVHQ
ncbi:hypothetical protein [Acinetobacter defluvii]|uniref:hypothetical protein n=1 Tax=Acinetobacter defluvii TaxID=1871111 RepID=UPI003AF61B35